MPSVLSSAPRPDRPVPAGLAVRDFIAADGPACHTIYRTALVAGHSSFERPDISRARFLASLPPAQTIVLAGAAGPVGLAWYRRVSERAVYAGVAESSIYIAVAAGGRGLGRQLLTALTGHSERNGFWSLRSMIFAENAASIALHEKCGFRRVGRHERIGKMTYGPMAGRWRDILCMERRSPLFAD